jgi:hypothetical protein
MGWMAGDIFSAETVFFSLFPSDQFGGKKMIVFWVVAPCSLVEIYRRFKSACCLRHHGDESASTSGDGGSKYL